MTLCDVTENWPRELPANHAGVRTIASTVVKKMQRGYYVNTSKNKKMVTRLFITFPPRFDWLRRPCRRLECLQSRGPYC